MQNVLKHWLNVNHDIQNSAKKLKHVQFYILRLRKSKVHANGFQRVKARFHYERGKEHSFSLLLIFD